MLRRQLNIAKALLQKQIPRAKISKVLYFLRYYVQFANPENVAKFDNGIIYLNSNKNAMGIEEMLVERAEKRGIEKGKELVITSLLQNTDFDTAKIAMLAGVPQAYVEDIKVALTANK